MIFAGSLQVPAIPLRPMVRWRTQTTVPGVNGLRVALSPLYLPPHASCLPYSVAGAGLRLVHAVGPIRLVARDDLPAQVAPSPPSPPPPSASPASPPSSN